nr:hypothetical protein [Nitrosomonas nitrosa]
MSDFDNEKYEQIINYIEVGDFQQSLYLLSSVTDQEAYMATLRRITSDLHREMDRVYSAICRVDRGLCHQIDIGATVSASRRLFRDLWIVADLDEIRRRVRTILRQLGDAHDRGMRYLRRSDRRNFAEETLFPQGFKILINYAEFLDFALDPEFRVNISEMFTLLGIDEITPFTLSAHIVPYLSATIELQNILSALQDKTPSSLPEIRAITHNSPIGIQMDGVGDAINVVRDSVVPWRRKNARRMAELAEMEKRREIKRVEAEIIDLRTRTLQTKIDNRIKKEELEQKKLETDRMRLESEQLRIEIDRQRLELERQKIELALSIVDRFSHNLSETERITYITKLLNPLGLLTDTPLHLSSDNKTEE